MDFSKSATIEAANVAANQTGNDMIVYPEPNLGEGAWDYMNKKSFDENGYESSDQAVIVRSGNNK